MKTALGCLFWLAAYAASAAALAWIVERRIGAREPAIAAGVLIGFILLIAIGALAEIFRRALGMNWSARDIAEHEPIEGERYLAYGPIDAGSTRLTSPITAVPAIAYTYEIKTGAGRWQGYAMAPARIQCGMRTVRVLGLPKLELKKMRHRGSQYERNAEIFCSTAEFEILDLKQALAMVRENGAVEGELDGEVRRDSGSGRYASLRGATLYEQLVEPGDVVSVIGTWSSARGGLIVEPGQKKNSLRLWRGRPPGLGSLAIGSVGSLVKAAIALAVVIIPLAALHAFVSLDVVEGFRPDFQASWPEVRIESILDAQLHPRIAAAGFGPVPEVDPGRGLAAGQALGRVLADDREIAIHRARAQVLGDGTIRIELVGEEGAVGTLSVSAAGQLLAADLAGRSIDPGRIPIRAFKFAPVDGGWAGRLNWYEAGLGVRVRFRV